MKILFTGGSSFTGFWFIKKLLDAGYEIFATFTKSDINEYSGIRKKRIEKIIKNIKPIWGVKFGDEQFIRILKNEKIDFLCHHAAYIENYKSENFNFIKALEKNTYNIQEVFSIIANSSCKGVVLTGSIFEQEEGYGERPLRSFSNYGLSKSLTSIVFKDFCARYGLKFGKFVIPNPFGPFEEQRFTTYLINQWKKNLIAEVKTPLYIRDNIHVSLLAYVYKFFVEKVFNENELFFKINPSGYVETQGDFAKRFAKEMEKRLNIECKLNFAIQQEFTEPNIRINFDKANKLIKNWSEEKAWDELAIFYEEYILK